MALAGYALTRAIIVAAVFLVLLFVKQGVYSVAAAFVASLLIYAYLLQSGGSSVEGRM